MLSAPFIAIDRLTNTLLRTQMPTMHTHHHHFSLWWFSFTIREPLLFFKHPIPPKSLSLQIWYLRLVYSIQCQAAGTVRCAHWGCTQPPPPSPASCGQLVPLYDSTRNQAHCPCKGSSSGPGRQDVHTFGLVSSSVHWQMHVYPSIHFLNHTAIIFILSVLIVDATDVACFVWSLVLVYLHRLNVCCPFLDTMLFLNCVWSNCSLMRIHNESWITSWLVTFLFSNICNVVNGFIISHSVLAGDCWDNMWCVHMRHFRLFAFSHHGSMIDSIAPWVLSWESWEIILVIRIAPFVETHPSPALSIWRWNSDGHWRVTVTWAGSSLRINHDWLFWNYHHCYCPVRRIKRGHVLSSSSPYCWMVWVWRITRSISRRVNNCSSDWS